MLAAYRRMLEYSEGGSAQGAVTRNAAEKKLNSLLDAVAATAAQQQAQAQAQLAQAQAQQQAQASQQQGSQQQQEGGDGAGGEASSAAAIAAAKQKADAAAELLRAFYEQTVAALDRGRNERLWFKASMRLAHLALERADYAQAAQLLRQLHRACRLPAPEGGGGAEGAGAIDPARGTQALEVYAAEIRMATEQRDNKRLKELYHQVRSTIGWRRGFARRPNRQRAPPPPHSPLPASAKKKTTTPKHQHRPSRSSRLSPTRAS
jgi:hypothetical protein